MNPLPKGLAALVVVAVALGPQATSGGVLGEVRYSPETAHPAQNSAPAGAATWRYAHPVVLPATARSGASTSPLAPPRNSTYIQPTITQHPQPAPPQHLFGYPTHLDPLYEEPTRPAWQQQHVEWQDFDRPAYDRPEYEKPLYGLDAAIKPAYERPLCVLPNDAKPNNYLKNYEAPPSIAPTMPLPDVRGPNYVIKPEVAPAYSPPIYDNPAWGHPEYLAPNYIPAEYAPPRELPVPYMGPPK